MDRNSVQALGWLATAIGIVPLVWLVALLVAGEKRGAEWWWLAAAYGVSFVADVVGYFLYKAGTPAASRWAVTAVYPVSQAGIIGLVLLTRRDAMRFLSVLLVVAVFAVALRRGSGPDVLLTAVAFGAIAGIVVDRWEFGRLRTALLVSFGLGLVAWYGYVLVPGLATWGVWQGVRLLGTILFCAAALRPVPSLRLS